MPTATGDYVSTNGLNAGGTPMNQIKKNGEPPVRLHSYYSVPMVQAILDGLPRGFTEAIPEAERLEYISSLERAETVKEAVRIVVKAAQHTELATKLLIELDRNQYDQRWNCKKCGYRYGRHDQETGACPKVNADVDQSLFR